MFSPNSANILNELVKLFNIFIGLEKDMTIQLPSNIADTIPFDNYAAILYLDAIEPEEMC
jgi:hypothetical protein